MERDKYIEESSQNKASPSCWVRRGRYCTMLLPRGLARGSSHFCPSRSPIPDCVCERVPSNRVCVSVCPIVVHVSSSLVEIALATGGSRNIVCCDVVRAARGESRRGGTRLLLMMAARGPDWPVCKLGVGGNSLGNRRGDRQVDTSRDHPWPWLGIPAGLARASSLGVQRTSRCGRKVGIMIPTNTGEVMRLEMGQWRTSPLRAAHAPGRHKS